MTELREKPKFFVLHEPDGETNGEANGGDGSVTRPFHSLPQALTAIGQNRLEAAFAATERPRKKLFELIFTDRPGASAPAKKKQGHQYYINTRAGILQGDGSEFAPWPDLESALDGMARLYETGKLKPRPGERVRLLHREVFTPTRFEKRKKSNETIAKYTFLAMAIALVLPVVAILGYLVIQAWPALTPSFLLQNPMNRMTAGGVWAPLVGTFFLVLGSLLIAAPTGVLAGVYLNEYARDNWATRIINLAVVNLAGVPSIVHGLFGVGAFVYFAHMGRSLLAAACTVAVMTLPVIITSTREALKAVPMSFREACWNMGASRWQTIRTIVLPNSISGILTGVILQVARAAGETAPILFTGAVFFVPVAESGFRAFIPYGAGDRFMALSYHLWTVSTQVQGVAPAVQYGTAVVLIGLVLVVNSLSIGLRMYLRSRKKW